MNILVIGKFYTEGFALHIAETLQAMGHEVIRFEPGVKYGNHGGIVATRWRQVKSAFYELARKLPSIQGLQTNRLLRMAGQDKIQLTMVCYDFLLPNEVQILKKITKAPIVLWFPDHIANFQKMCFLNADYDALFFKDPYITHVLGRNLRKPVFYLPECCNPHCHKFVELSKEDANTYGCEITTAGNMHSYRAAFFSQLNDYRVKLWGNSPPLWMDISGVKGMMQNQSVFNEDKSKAFRAAKIVINNLQPAEIWGVNVRTFEIAAAGGFQLIDWRPGLAQLFVDGEELVSFKNMDDLKNKIDYYLNHEQERLRIAEQGMHRAHQDHTYEKRLKILLETVFNGAHGFPMPDIPFYHD